MTYIIDVRGGNSSSGYINSGLGAGRDHDLFSHNGILSLCSV